MTSFYMLRVVEIGASCAQYQAMWNLRQRLGRMRHMVAIGFALGLGFACSSIRRQELSWQPATVNITARIALNVFRANGDCQESVTLEAMLNVQPSDEQQKVFLKPWGPGTWEQGKLYEVEIAHEVTPRGEELTWVRKRPNPAPEPTATSVTPPAEAGVAPAVAHR